MEFSGGWFSISGGVEDGPDPPLAPACCHLPSPAPPNHNTSNLAAAGSTSAVKEADRVLDHFRGEGGMGRRNQAAACFILYCGRHVPAVLITVSFIS